MHEPYPPPWELALKHVKVAVHAIETCGLAGSVLLHTA
jgi:hypothetical protein